MSGHATVFPRLRAAELSPGDLARLVGRPAPTQEQASAISAPLVPAVVEAGAGSGKTETMASRVVWLVATGRVAPAHILGLTFTRKAAAELSSRIASRLTGARAAMLRQGLIDAATAEQLALGEPTVMTYHAYASRLLSEHAALVGVEPSSRLAGEAACWQIARSVVDTWGGPLEELGLAPATVTGLVLRLAAETGEHLISPADIERHTRDLLRHARRLPRGAGSRSAPREARQDAPGEPYADTARMLSRQTARLQLLDLVAEYASRKRAMRVLDHGDQVSLAARLAQGHPGVGDLERTRFTAVLLDEYQDTSPSQDVLLRALFGHGHPVMAVGDPNQAIYGWRGASADAMVRFGRDYRLPDGSAPARFRLGVSFRNSERVLAVANALSRPLYRPGTATSELRCGTGERGDVVAASFPTGAEEAAWIAEEVDRLVSDGLPAEEIAVVVRKRSLLPRIAEAISARGIPTDSTQTAGLLDQPEVAQVIATLRCLVDPEAGSALALLLAGPAWRVSPRDMMQLASRSRELDPDSPSLLEALESLGAPARYSREGHVRLTRLRAQLRSLRRFTAEPLADLVTRVVTTTGWDLEVQLLRDRSPESARAHLDRLCHVAAEFDIAAPGTPVSSFLDYLDVAADREDGLEPGMVGGARRPPGLGSGPAARPAAVSLLTAHGAKGLEWTAVFVAGMTRDVFPDGQPSASWLTDLGAVPVDLRADAADLPRWRGQIADTQQGLRDSLAEHRADWKQHDLREERRLAYVAVTRARQWLRCSGVWWSEGTTRPRGPSPLLTEVRKACATPDSSYPSPAAPWAPAPEDGTTNPLRSASDTALWPVDPLGGRREAVEDGAALVRAAMSELAAGRVGPTDSNDNQDDEVGALLRSLTQRRDPAPMGAGALTVPDHLSVSEVVALTRDREAAIRRMLRPMPQPPTGEAQRGSAFHAWLERRFAVVRPLDFDDMLPYDEIPSGDSDPRLDALVGAFLTSPWADRVPDQVEVPFDTAVGGFPVRGRIDAVFREPDGSWLVVDWKTGAEPRGTVAEAAAVQLDVYRKAWAELANVPLSRVDGAFHYVSTGRTVRLARDSGPELVSTVLRSLRVTTS